MIRFSVVIPVHNGEREIKRAIDCVLTQSYEYYELIIVNDGSTDETETILKSYIERDDVTIINCKNGGPSKARNIGVKHARYEYVAFLDADDFWVNTHLANIANLIVANPNYPIYASGYSRIDGYEVPTEAHIFQSKTDLTYRKYNLSRYLLNRLLGRRIAWTSAVVVSRLHFLEINGFDEKYMHGEDQGLWLQLVARKGLIKSNNRTAYYIHTNEGLSSKPVLKIDGVMNVINQMLDTQSHPIITKILLFELYNRYAIAHLIGSIHRKDEESFKFFSEVSRKTIFYFIKRAAYIYFFKTRQIFSRKA